jgi:hypothetical protein
VVGWAQDLGAIVVAGYPRWTDLSFLEFCDSRIRGFYEYWELKRGERAMPSRADIDPAEIVSYLPSIVMVDVLSADRLELRYRLAGTLETEARGYDPTGRSVSDSFQGTSSIDVLENYRLVIARRRPVFDTACVPTTQQRLLEKGTILLPLSDDGENVNIVIVYTAFDRVGYPERLKSDPAELQEERPTRISQRPWSLYRSKTRLRRRTRKHGVPLFGQSKIGRGTRRRLHKARSA